MAYYNNTYLIKIKLGLDTFINQILLTIIEIPKILLKNIFKKYSKLNLKTKIDLYNLLLKPIWIYCIQLVRISNTIIKFKYFKTKFFITNAPPYTFQMPYYIVHKDLRNSLIKTVARQFHNRLHTHTNPLISTYLHYHFQETPLPSDD